MTATSSANLFPTTDEVEKYLFVFLKEECEKDFNSFVVLATILAAIFGTRNANKNISN
jgi:hypothetical protein